MNISYFLTSLSTIVIAKLFNLNTFKVEFKIYYKDLDDRKFEFIIYYVRQYAGIHLNQSHLINVHLLIHANSLLCTISKYPSITLLDQPLKHLKP